MLGRARWDGGRVVGCLGLRGGKVRAAGRLRAEVPCAARGRCGVGRRRGARGQRTAPRDPPVLDVSPSRFAGQVHRITVFWSRVFLWFFARVSIAIPHDLLLAFSTPFVSLFLRFCYGKQRKLSVGGAGARPARRRRVLPRTGPLPHWGTLPIGRKSRFCKEPRRGEAPRVRATWPCSALRCEPSPHLRTPLPPNAPLFRRRTKSKTLTTMFS